MLCCCLGGQPETKFICPDGSVASQRSDCPQTEHYVCSNGRVVHDPGECPKPKSSTTLITKYICPDGRVVEDFNECGITSSTTKETASTSTSTTTLPEGGIRIIGLDLGDEWVWLANRDSYMIDLSDWFLRDREDHTYLFPNGFKLMPATSVRVHTGSGIDSPTDLYWGRDGGVWNNKGDTAYLWDSELNLVDELSVGVVEESTTSTTTTTTSSSTTSSTSSSTTSTQTSTSTTSTTTSISTSTTSTSTTTSSTVPVGSVLITEVMYDLPGSDSGREWIEIYAKDYTVDLSNWRLEEEKINGKTIQHMLKEYQGVMLLERGDYAVIADNPDAFLEDHPSYSEVLIDSSFDLVNSALTLRLLDKKDGREIDLVFYIDAGAAGNGLTLIRDEDSLVEGSVEGGTPGS